MTFTNQLITSESLPHIADITWESLAPAYRTTNIALSGSLFTLIALVCGAVMFQPWVTLDQFPTQALTVIAVVSLLLGGVICTYHYFADPLVRYAVREHDIALTKGLIFKSTTCQPILRIQHVEVKRGPIQRLVGLATLQVFSAGGALYTFRIPGLRYETADQLRNFVIEHHDMKVG